MKKKSKRSVKDIPLNQKVNKIVKMINNSLHFTLTKNYTIELDRSGFKSPKYLLFRKIKDPLEDGFIEQVVEELNKEELERFIKLFFKKDFNE
jgi:hypothetical protein